MGNATWIGIALLTGHALARTVGAAETELVLVDQGASLAPIVIFADAPPRTRVTADELADFIEKISGARPDVLEGAPEPVPERAIWVGFQPKLKELFPETDFVFKHAEEILIAANENHLVLAGRDRWDPEHLFKPGKYRGFEGWQREYGTANAVYTFLRDYLDIRWLWPGELGLDIVPRERIALAPFEYRYHPQIRGRSQAFAFSAEPGHPYGVAHGGRQAPFALNWLSFQRVQLDSLEVAGGHPFSGWWERFHESHPEYFALQPDGTRGGGEKPYPSARNIKLCESNPAVWEQVLADWADVIRNNPHQRIFHASHGDGGFSGFCICENCRAWDHPDGERRRFVWQGISQEYLSISDRHVIWANTLARRLAERYPDREYYVQVHAYGHTWAPPVEAVPDENVMISGVHSFLTGDSPDRMSPTGTTKREQYAGWAAVTKNLAWRPNTGGRNGLPFAPLEAVIDSMRFAAKQDTIGMFIDLIWEHWVTQGPMYYLIAHLSWDPALDAQALLDDYFQRGFGPAGDAIAAYWALLDTRLSLPEAEGERYDTAFFEQAEALFEQARRAVTDRPEKYRQRVDYMHLGLEYVRLIKENLALVAHYRESDGAEIEAANRARANWERIEEIVRRPATLNSATIRRTERSLRDTHPDD